MPTSKAFRKNALWLSLVLGGCASTGLPQVVDPAEVPAASGGAPTITRIRDVGTPLVPRTGAIEGITDGVAGPGELLVVEGNRFGRQPTVTVESRPTVVLARTDGGGVVVRVPHGVRAGKVDVTVSSSEGGSHLTTTIRRLAVALDGETLRFASVGDEVVAVGELSVPGARSVRIDSSGGVAIVVGGSKLTVVDLGRAQPAVLGVLPLGHAADVLAVASEAPRSIAIGAGKLTVLDTTSVRRPVLFDPVALPKEVTGVRSAALSPDGKTLALLVQGNRVVALDVTTPTAPQLVNAIDVLPGEHQPLAREVVFAPDGNTLWVVSGLSAETYPQVIPTRVTAIKLVATSPDGAPLDDAVTTPAARRLLAVWKTQTIPTIGAPMSIVVGNAPDAQGSAIRTAPEVASVYVSSVDSRLFAKAPLAHANGTITRAELGTGGQAVATTRELLGALALLPDGTHVAAFAQRPGDGDVLDVGVATVSLDGQTAVRFAPLRTSSQKLLAAPFRLGDLVVQP